MGKLIKTSEYFNIVSTAAPKFKPGSLKPLPKVPFFLYTGNADKIEEFNHYFSDTDFYFLGLGDLKPELKDNAKNNEPPEDGETLLENSTIKSRYGFGVSGIATVADDTGFFIDALGGEPGVKAGRYAGPTCDYEANRQLVFKKLSGVSDDKRTACFRCMITMAYPGAGKNFEFLGEASGTILHEKRPGNQFGYDPIFMPDGYKIAFSEMDLGLKNSISHRGRAFKKLHDFLLDNIEN